MVDSFLTTRLNRLRLAGTYRKLPGNVTGVDFWSNDYLGLAQQPNSPAVHPPGSTGSRLISGDHRDYHTLEARIAAYHGQPAALVFNSGYTANLGLLSALLHRTDTIVYDELSHACCRDGIRLGQARALRFRHNDLEDLQIQLAKARGDGQVFVLTEGRFSMDGDLAPLREIMAICMASGARLIVDEAHSGGIEGEKGAGLVAALGLQKQVFATVITYGKAFGCHGAAILGNPALREYLVNTCRPFIYTTGPAPAQWEGIARAYERMEQLHTTQLTYLQNNITHFREAAVASGLTARLADVSGPIQVVAYPGNAAVLEAEAACREAGLLVKAIRSPTVAVGQERLRICLHAFNREEDITRLVEL
ncbi:MAG: 8-amino-7-oxononanoate synthase, partial [Bacteroidota bacterium]